MNNLELEKCFQEIAAKANIFDKRIALRKFKKNTKKVSFSARLGCLFTKLLQFMK